MTRPAPDLAPDNRNGVLHPHTRRWNELAAELATDPAHGLTHGEASHRLAKHGPNELQAGHGVSPWSVFAGQFKNVLVIILLVAVGLSAFLGHGIEAATITIIVLFAVLLGFAQEYRAERAMEALRQMASPRATVIRDGQEIEIPAREVVPGDIAVLRVGDRVSADARLIEAVNFQIDEAVLTGESFPVEKNTEPLDDPALPVGDRRNMAHAGTAVTYGRGRALVVATGGGTEFGRIATLLESVKTSRTPLQQNLDRVGHVLALAAATIVAIIVSLGLLRGEPFVEMLIFGIALAVAVVPEALPAVVTICLAIGVQRMAKRNALVRRLPAVETLGGTSVICSDKTGTLTRDEMTARKVVAGGQVIDISGTGYDPEGTFSLNGQRLDPPEALNRLLQAAALASDARLIKIDGHWTLKGDPTEGALVVAAAKAGLNKVDLDAKFPRIHEIPFTSETKRMTTLHSGPEGTVAFSKGAQEVILKSSTSLLTGNGPAALDEDGREALTEAARQMAHEALRVLAVAAKPGATQEDAERDMTFLGLVGMYDPPRPEVRQAIQTCRLAGIKPVMITGDHPVTARSVARELGLLKTGRVLTGPELETIDDDRFRRDVEEIEVYARVSPAHKLRIVTALQAQGHVVAMTGDGVNDAPALKKADIGIAMGITGTDVTKEAAAMTLTDDNFATIVAAVEEGRSIFNNIRNFLMYLLSTNVAEIGLIAGAALLGLPLPLTAVQILYVNLATDGLPALALSLEPPEKDLMRRPPRAPGAGIFTRHVIVLMAAAGLWSTVVNLGYFSWLVLSGGELRDARAMIFVTLIMIELIKAYNFRSDRRSLLSQLLGNRWLNLATGWEVALLVIVVYTPFFQAPLGTISIAPFDWIIVMTLALSVIPIMEWIKWLARRGALGKMA